MIDQTDQPVRLLLLVCWPMHLKLEPLFLRVMIAMDTFFITFPH